MYRIFFDSVVSGDVLFLLLEPEAKVTRSVTKEGVCALYSGDQLVGANIFAFAAAYPLKSRGVIFAPADELIDALNARLLKAALPTLPYCRDSLYRVASIKALEEHPLDEKAQIVSLSLGEKELTTVSWYSNLEVGAKVVIALDGAIRYDGSVFHAFVSRNIPNDASICSSRELLLEDAPGAYLTSLETGTDFFLGGK